MSGREDSLAYGHYAGAEESTRAGGGEGERGLIGDTFKKLRDTYKTYNDSGTYQGPQSAQGPQQSYNPASYSGQAISPGYQTYSSQPSYTSAAPGSNQQYHDPAYQGKQKHDLVSGLLDKLEGAVADISEEVTQRIGNKPYAQASAAYGVENPNTPNRYGSFAPQRQHNDVKWYVDGCSYFYAVSLALERAKESIWILDWWLSPELYLRRPPAKNQQYRVDRMLQAAAQRGVKVNIIVYKEVPQALSLSSEHTKHELESLHPNISVLRHPDHLPDHKEVEEVETSIVSGLENLTLDSAKLSTLSGDALKKVYGTKDDVVLYWAHHEKLCLIDGNIAFMGGLDLCFGRWDTNQHAIADFHPTDLNEIVYPGQDYNNARVLDFQDVSHWEKNQLDRKATPRMGWSDVSVSLHGPVVEDLRKHFVERWNFIYDTKYSSQEGCRYSKLTLYGRPSSSTGPTQGSHQGQYSSQQVQHSDQQGQYGGQQFPPPPPGPPPQQSTANTQEPYFPPPPTQETHFSQSRGFEQGNRGYQEENERGLENERRLREDLSGLGNVLRGHIHHYQDRYLGGHSQHNQYSQHASRPVGSFRCQIVRSCSPWSHGVPTEHSIQDAYAAIIRDSQHFVYIENQFFITATGDEQKPVKNKIGAAIVERILRAARAGEKYKIIVVIPSVPAFTGDLLEDSSLGTRAIMEFQYSSINRGGHSIMELIAKEGYNPQDYIRFYNLRNYDRINAGGVATQIEKQSGVGYEDARKQHDVTTAGYGGYGPGAPTAHGFDTTVPYAQYQQTAQQYSTTKPGAGRWDSVSECYMLGGEDIRKVPWDDSGNMSEIDAFVSEELYIHSKVLIADDRYVICGSANLNDRSQVGDHDSEIAIIIEDPTPVESTMDGKPWTVSRFATSLRRQLFRKHLGLLPAQDYTRLDANSEPVGVPNIYDLDSPESRIVADPLSDTFQSLWNTRARTNTEVYRQIFHPVPDDTVRDWNTYKEFFEYYFHKAVENADGKDELLERPAKYKWGHVVRDNFPQGPEGARQVKELLSKVKGTLVEMPLVFLIDEDIAKTGLTLNPLTEPIYT